MVGFYFNTNNMSAILKALKNRKVEVELKSEKVEFGMIEDYNKRIDKANNDRLKAVSAFANLEGSLGLAIKGLELAEKEAIAIEKAAKELGVQSPVNSKEVNRKMSNLKSALNSILKARAEVK